MRGHADRLPEGGSLAEGAMLAARVEPASHDFEDRRAGPSGPDPAPFAFEIRGIWPRRPGRALRETSPWILVAWATLIVVSATIGVVAWLNRPEVRRVGDLRVDVLLIEGAWRFGKEAVATD